MSTYHPFYQILHQFVSQTCTELSGWAKARLVWFIFGILVSQSVVFSRIAHRQSSVLPHSILVASGERRLRRIAKDPQLDWNRAYRRAVQTVLAKATESKRLVVLVDETAQAEHYRLLVAALWYRGRAISLAWHLRPAKAGGFWEAMRQVLAETALVLPPKVEVVVVADRGFGTPCFTDLVASMGWEWLVRLPSQTRFQAKTGQVEKVGGWLTKVGQRRRGWGKLFKKQGWRSGSLVGIWQGKHKEPLLLGSSLPPDYALVRLYKYRYAIESLFRDSKSLGFQWESSQVRNLEQAAKVVLGMFWGGLVAIVLGEQVAEEELARPATGKRTTRPAMARFSLAYLGLERVQSYLVGKVLKPVEWQLEHYEAERWSRQLHQHHALPALASSLPLPLLRAA